jgi:hypothetical protein
MNLKEFDAKQFLLEKGERVGLGIALTLMVAMLVFSLFMPSKGLFSASPATKAEELTKDTKALENALASKPLPDSEKPDTDKSRLIKLDTTYLRRENYATLPWFTPGSKENPARRPPEIYNIEEAVAKFVVVPIDTYLFNRDFSQIYVLREEGKSVKTNGPAGNNPFAAMKGRMPMPGGPGGPGGGAAAMYNQTRGRLNMPNAGNSLNGIPGKDNPEYKAVAIPVDKWSDQELTAHQPRPLRMAIVAGSFPYRRELEEFKNQLRLPSLEDVRNELDKDGKDNSFRFITVRVERLEVDADGKEIEGWKPLDLASNYELWLRSTFLPFQAEDPKYSLVSFLGLVAPLLREFQPNKAVNPGMGMVQPGLMTQKAEPEADVKTKYPDVAAELPKIRDTLAALADTKPTQIAAPKTKQSNFRIDPFNPNAAPPPENAPAGGNAGNPADNEKATYPEYCLVRFVDVNIEPGRGYRYRVKIRMANPNYQRDDVASPAYKQDEYLESKNWFEIKDTVRVPQEQFFYVVDEKQGINPRKDKDKMPPAGSAQFRLWNTPDPSRDQVVFQFHRWLEQVPIGSKSDTTILPVGDWAIADRVLVGRGEVVGRKVKIDLPIWKYRQNTFILPAEEAPKRTRKKDITTGIEVDFSQEKANNETILVDFDGGKTALAKVVATSRIEVLMLDPDGKLLARNNVKDKEDEEREKRRAEVLNRIKDIREGKDKE